MMNNKITTNRKKYVMNLQFFRHKKRPVRKRTSPINPITMKTKIVLLNAHKYLCINQ